MATNRKFYRLCEVDSALLELKQITQVMVTYSDDQNANEKELDSLIKEFFEIAKKRLNARNQNVNYAIVQCDSKLNAQYILQFHGFYYQKEKILSSLSFEKFRKLETLTSNALIAAFDSEGENLFNDMIKTEYNQLFAYCKRNFKDKYYE